MSQIDQEQIPALDIPVVEYFTKTAISLFRQFVYGQDDDSSKYNAYKDFNNAAMFQVAEVEVNPKNSSGKTPANASYSLSVKNTESYRLARRYAGQNETFISIVTVPQTIYEEYDIIYMNQYDSLLVGKERKIWNPFSKREVTKGEEVIEYPKNVTLKEVYVDNLYGEVSLLNMSFFSDADPEHKFRKLFTNAIIKKDGLY